MALIKCPNCNNDVSDLANTCPSCGYKIKGGDQGVMLCPDCQTKLTGEEYNCPKCGRPLKGNEADLQKVEIASNNIKKDKKKRKRNLIILIAVVLVLVIAGGIGIFIYQKNLANEKEREELAEQQIETEYSDNMKSAITYMQRGTAQAKSIGELTHSVWYNAIFKESDNQTDVFTKKSYDKWYDFNTALYNLYMDEDYSARIKRLENNQGFVAETMKLLTNPPEKYEEAYENIKDYYSTYLELTNLVISPTGTLQTFTENYNNAVSAVSKYDDTMKIYLEE